MLVYYEVEKDFQMESLFSAVLWRDCTYTCPQVHTASYLLLKVSLFMHVLDLYCLSHVQNISLLFNLRHRYKVFTV